MPTPKSPAAQRGAATLVVTLTLLFVMLLVLVYVNRNLVFEQRSAANQARSTQAFEAAEAGLEWAQAQLNGRGRIGADCRPSGDAAAAPFRERLLNHDAASASFTPATWLQGTLPMARQAACVRGSAGWTCSCPLSGQPVLSTPEGTAPAFLVRFEGLAQPGVVRLLATGCNRLGGECAPGSAASAEATAHVELTLGLVPALKTAPAAALTAKGHIDAGAAALGAHHSDAATGGIALHAGGSIDASAARITGPAGSVADDAVLANDSALASLDVDAFFVSHFGMRASAWQQQPAVTTLRCEGPCGTALLGAIEPGIVNPLVYVEGELQLDGPLVLGTPERPVAIVASGAAQLRGAVTIHGVLYSRGLRWDATAGTGALVRGAALTDGSYAGSGAPDLAYDAAVLALLKSRAGSFARVNGSWRDF
jgi:Tfp pilus assembly protein PilX